MNSHEKSLAMDSSSKHLFGVFFILAALLCLANIPWALAQEVQNSSTIKEPSQPVVQTSVNSEANGKNTTSMGISTPAKTSVDFLMGESPLSQNTPQNAASTPNALTTESLSPTLHPITLPNLPDTSLEKPEEVAMLVSEKCSQSGNTPEGTDTCARIYSNGHHATVLIQKANEGDEIKRQTVIEEFDADNTLLYRKTIRNRVDYNYLNNRKSKEKEFFDIVYQPAGRKATRELMVYEYFLDTGKAKSLAWTQYKQIGNEPRAGLVYHAMLRYGNDGSPDRGIAEMWNNGKKTETFMNWSRLSKGYATLDEETWKQWEGWIRNVSLQAHLP